MVHRISTASLSTPASPRLCTPFNIQKLGSTIYVTYAGAGHRKHDDVAGAGHGFVSVFDSTVPSLARVCQAGTLNRPGGSRWRRTSFGSIAGDLLVGNFGDGRINVFNLATDSFWVS